MNSATHDTDHLILLAETAADLMTRKPLSISQDATVPEAATFLISKEISAAPVINDAGHPVGVLSHTDLVRLQGHPNESLTHCPDYYHVADLFWPPALRNLMHIKKAEHTHVKDVMTSAVHSVRPDDSVITVVSKLLAIKVHRLFVIDESGVLVGVISAFDILRKLHK